MKKYWIVFFFLSLYSVACQESGNDSGDQTDDGDDIEVTDEDDIMDEDEAAAPVGEASPMLADIDYLPEESSARIREVLRSNADPRGATVRMNYVEFPAEAEFLPQDNGNHGKEIYNLARLMRAYPELIILISAHAPDHGADITPVALGKRRGMFLKSELIRHGIEAYRIDTEGIRTDAADVSDPYVQVTVLDNQRDRGTAN